MSPGQHPHYDLIAIDLDGTLLDGRHELSAAHRAALHRAHAAGLQVVLCTGRAYPETLPTIQAIGLDLDAAITVFGAMVTDVRSGRTVERAAFDRETARTLTEWFRTHGFAVMWLADREELGFDGYAIDGPRRHAAVDNYLAITPCDIRRVSEPPYDGPVPLRISIIDERTVLEPIAAAMRATFDGQVACNVLTAPAWELTVIESFAPQVNKWYGIQRLCQRWGIDPRRTVAVGDDVNDLEMLRHAGLGVAMGNARDCVKKVAQRVTGTNDEFGVAMLIDELLA